MLVGCCSTSVVNGCCRVVESAGEVVLVGCGNGCCGNGCCSTSVVNGCCRVIESAGEVVLVKSCSIGTYSGIIFIISNKITVCNITILNATTWRQRKSTIDSPCIIL